MSKMMKALIVIVAIVFVVLGVALLVMDYAAKHGIEMAAAAALGVDTSVEAVSIKVLQSSVSIEGLQISNPKGYKSVRLLALGSGTVSCDVPTLLSDEVRVKEIILDEPDVTIEMKPGVPPKSNIGELLDNLDSGQPTPEEKQKQKHFKIDLIRVTNTRVRFHTLDGKTADVVLPEIEMRDVKNADGTPVVFADVLGQILARIGASSLEQAKGVVPKEFRSAYGKTLGSAKSLIARGTDAKPGLFGDIFGKKKNK